jgi:hypothetical protein
VRINSSVRPNQLIPRARAGQFISCKGPVGCRRDQRAQPATLVEQTQLKCRFLTNKAGAGVLRVRRDGELGRAARTVISRGHAQLAGSA